MKEGKRTNKENEYRKRGEQKEIALVNLIAPGKG